MYFCAACGSDLTAIFYTLEGTPILYKSTSTDYIVGVEILLGVHNGSNLIPDELTPEQI